MPVNTVLAVIMPLVPWAYVVRQGGGNRLRAARVKLDRLKQHGKVTVTDGLVSVALAKNSYGSLIRQGVKSLNSTGQCDMSAIWSNKATALWIIGEMKRLGWISQSDKWPVVTFIGREPATVEAFNLQRRERRRRGAKQ